MPDLNDFYAFKMTSSGGGSGGERNNSSNNSGGKWRFRLCYCIDCIGSHRLGALSDR